MSATKTNRYTASNLEADLIRFNSILEKSNHNFRLTITGANGSTYINLATPEQMARKVCERALVIGKPRHCKAEIESYIVSVISSSSSK